MNPQASIINSVYVDDLLFFPPEISRINIVKGQLKREYKMKDLGEIGHILGMRVRRHAVQDSNTESDSVHQQFHFEIWDGELSPGLDSNRSMDTHH